MLPQKGMKENALGLVLKYVPKNLLSYVVGFLVYLRLPGPLRLWSLRWFAGRYKIKMNEAEYPLEQYRSIGDLFIRYLKTGLRPIAAGVVHPVDGKLTENGEIRSGILIQAKGRNYSVSEFVGSDEAASIFEGGLFATYYLCPTDYHRVHSPVTGVIEKVTYLPGYLWPVNPWSVNSIDRLFAVNERVVMWIKTPRGRACVVMVGATNVGKMTLSFDPRIISNSSLLGARKTEKNYEPAIPIAAGSELGVFNMGSTVIVLYEKGLMDGPFKTGPVLLGQPANK